ncbi:AAA family ATPase [Cohaesibacter haloalkalitolerans]|uniref:AAA family ATPase n=1 Tax=Cohaesibacter haloalkalitolerans TaxID=1162980 RepID=UPI000E64993A|nr:AAA family ATPase [Cohaesibacter haloalkalitolerans]
MFSQRVMAELLERHGDLFSDLVAVKKTLNERFYGLSEQIHCQMLAVASGESMLLIGPPGTAKSRLIRAFAHLCGLLGDDELLGNESHGENGVLRQLQQEPRYFEYLLTPFTEPGELFGFFDIGKLFDANGRSGGLERLHEGMMQHAEIIFLDEVFNASSAILNSLLTFINEHKFHDRGKSFEVNLSCLFGATNYPPKRPELLAIYDRFLLRSWVDNVPSEPHAIGALIQTGWQESHAADLGVTFPLLLERAELFRADLRAMSQSGGLSIDLQDDGVNDMLVRLTCIADYARGRRLSQLSNRRLVRFSRIFLVNALMRAAEKGEAQPMADIGEDLMLLARHGLDRLPDPFQENDLMSLLVKGQL